jgi:hypothetical protein
MFSIVLWGQSLNVFKNFAATRGRVNFGMLLMVLLPHHIERAGYGGSQQITGLIPLSPTRAAPGGGQADDIS